MAQTSEKNVICAMYDHFSADPNLEVGALIHDGLHLKTTDIGNQAGTISDTVLRNAEHVYDHSSLYSSLALPAEAPLDHNFRYPSAE
jgi:hypothetical protein